jgi:hypothetical protein
MDARRLRPAIAFLTVPLVPAVGYWLLVAWMMTLGNGPPSLPLTMTQIGAWYLQVSYTCMLLGWVPVVLLLRARRRTSTRDFALAGAVFGFGLTMLLTGMAPQFIPFALACAALGAGCGWLFLRIAGPGISKDAAGSP